MVDVLGTDSSESTAAVRPVNGKTKRLDLPMRIVLNEAGVSFFMERGRCLHRFVIADGGTRYGFRTRSIDFVWLKRLFVAGFVEKMEVQAVDVGEQK